MNWDFLKDVKMVLQIGAAKGNERKIYKHFDIDVIYVEALPDVYNILKSKTSGNPKWIALNYCVTDNDNQMIKFHRSSNRGLSSSIYNFADHKKIWTNINMVEDLDMTTITLPTMLQKENIDLLKYSGEIALILDTQGSEHLILKGADQIINNFKYILTEVCDFNAYDNCGKLKDIQDFMDGNGFDEEWRGLQVHKEELGSYWDILYKRNIQCHAN